MNSSDTHAHIAVCMCICALCTSLILIVHATLSGFLLGFDFWCNGLAFCMGLAFPAPYASGTPHKTKTASLAAETQRDMCTVSTSSGPNRRAHCSGLFPAASAQAFQRYLECVRATCATCSWPREKMRWRMPSSILRCDTQDAAVFHLF